MDADRKTYIETMMDIAWDFPDGAFLGFMAEKGIGVDELAEVSEANRKEKDPEVAGP